MATATLTSKGQITLPIKVRTALGLETGDRVEFVEMEDGKFSIIAASKTVRDLKGLIRKPAKAVSIDEMNRAIAAQGATPGWSGWIPTCWCAMSPRTIQFNPPRLTR